MKRKMVKRVAAMVLAGLVMVVFAGSAVANASDYAFTMNWRYVSGKENKRFHTLDSGELTLSGKIWVHQKRYDASPVPLPVRIEVLKGIDSERDVVCTLEVTPDVILNSKRAYSKSCGRIEGGSYWLRISKSKTQTSDGEGWHSQGSGTLTTR